MNKETQDFWEMVARAAARRQKPALAIMLKNEASTVRPRITPQGVVWEVQ
jgi:deoxyadenosine/deoxycytidine kinase